MSETNDKKPNNQNNIKRSAEIIGESFVGLRKATASLSMKSKSQELPTGEIVRFIKPSSTTETNTNNSTQKRNNKDE